MKTQLKLAVLALVSAFILQPSSLPAQGSLTPPGPPAPTMKTLTQVEPRTAITNLPYTIGNSGSYYLTGPHSSTNSGITVAANDVTLDLMGFTITGPSATNWPGVFVAGGTDVMLRNIVVKNGGISQFGVGVLVENAQSGCLRQLVVHQNTAEGVLIKNKNPGSCSDFTVEDSIVTDNGGAGISILGDSSGGNNRSHTLRNNKVSGNLEYGVYLMRASGCLVEGNHIGPQVPDASTNAFAVWSGSGRNLVVRNFEYGNFVGSLASYFFISGSDTHGPTVDVTGSLASTNKEAHPWANFSR